MSKRKKIIVINPWWKGFLTSILGTTISIALTFGTNTWLNASKKKEAQWHTALMALYDIDEIVKQMRADSEKEEACFEVASYLYTHQEEIDSVSVDSLKMAVIYLLEDPSAVPEWADDSKEKSFTNDIDTRQNLKHPQFYDNVQKCYRLRRDMLMLIEKDPLFKRPISAEDYSQFLQQVSDKELEFDGTLNDIALRRMLRQAFQQRSTDLYLRGYFARRSEYAMCAFKLEQLNKENKLIMGVSDEDIAEFVRQKVENSQPATPEMIVGTWETELQGDGKMEFSYQKDHTVVYTREIKAQLDLELIRENIHVPVLVPATFRINGRWKLEGDTLRQNYDNKTLKMLSIDVDFSKIPKAALERGKDSLDVKKQQIKELIIQQIKQSDWNQLRNVSFDMFGKIMIWQKQEKTPWGHTETSTEQLYRKEKE